MTVTTTIDATLRDSFLGYSTSYSNAREGSPAYGPDGAPYSLGQYQAAHPDNNFLVYQHLLQFDTSGIGASDEITGVQLKVTHNGAGQYSNNGWKMEARAYDWGATLEAADFRPGSSLYGLTLLADLVVPSYSGTSTLSSKAAFLTAPGIKNGICHIVLASDKQAANQAPTKIDLWTPRYDITTIGTPQLVITYEPGAPPSLVLNQADAVYLGANQADKVYLGAAQVWG